VAAVAILTTACGYGSGERAPERDGSPKSSRRPAFGRGTVILDKGRETVLLTVEVAQSPEQRSRGLMYRRSLPPDAGMVFVYFREHTGSFWMKNTLIPLSIAFFDQDGRIKRILDMSPCRRDPCRLYDPGVSYWGALEVNRGAFERWGVEEGDSVRLTQ
jgi:uncharacterized membrane protein (UPF0127 family)